MRSPSSRNQSESWAYRKLRTRILRARPICECCKTRPSAITHHIRAVSRGGQNDERNLLALCPSCDRLTENRSMPLREIQAKARVAGLLPYEHESTPYPTVLEGESRLFVFEPRPRQLVDLDDIDDEDRVGDEDDWY